MDRIRQISHGDMGALEEIYETYKTSVYRIALSMTGERAAAEDITQDTFLRIQEKAGTYRPAVGEAAWIYTIARNLARDVLRKRSRECFGQEDALYRQMSEEGDPEAGDYAFLDLIKNLQEKDAEVVCLRILADLSFQEIGQVTRASAGSCSKRYQRALKKLRREFLV